MAVITRRAFLASAAALPAACSTLKGRDGGASRDVSGGLTAPPPRPPVVGQAWRYAKRDRFTRAVVDTQVDRVTSVGRTVEIDSHVESDREGSSKSTSGWLRKYFAHPHPAAALPSEIQEPWGMVLVDPHWSEVQVYDTPIPLWPTQLAPGWETRIKARYKVSEGGDPLRWDQTMKAEAWETITVPAGRYQCLRYINVINFKSSDPGRGDSIRRETVWFAPELGRWAARESAGTYYLSQSVSDDVHEENSYRWDLLGVA
jgi:hypothetical protein